MQNIVRKSKFELSCKNFNFDLNQKIKTDTSISENDELIQTIFGKTPRLPTYLIGIALFKKSEFSYIETKTNLDKIVIIFNFFFPLTQPYKFQVKRECHVMVVGHNS